MIAMISKNFIIKVLVFTNIYLLSCWRLEDDTHTKCSNFIIANTCMMSIDFLPVFSIMKSLTSVIILFFKSAMLNLSRKEALNPVKEDKKDSE